MIIDPTQVLSWYQPHVGGGDRGVRIRMTANLVRHEVTAFLREYSLGWVSSQVGSWLES